MSEPGMHHETDDGAFHSLAAMRAAHNELLKRKRDEGDTPALLGAAVDFVRSGAATGAVLDLEDDRQAAQGLLTYWANALYRAGEAPPDAMLAEFDRESAPLLPESDCPYLGLDAFREEDREFFYGREDLVQRGLDWLKTHQLLAVTGPSGSGKSSLVRAGIVPALKNGAIEGSAGWQYLPPLVPGNDPLAALAAAGFDARDPAAPCVLLVDQLEELYTLTLNDDVRLAFVDRLIELAQTPEPRNTVILTMRTDFESQLQLTPKLQPAFEEARLAVTPMSAGDLRAAIEKPAQRVGLKFEEGVVEALLKDIVGEPAALPLLQFTLLKLWEQRDRNYISWEAYRRVGGGRLALARAADAFYDGLIPEDQVAAKRILLRMARPGTGLEVTNNRIPVDTLYTAGEARDRVDRVLDKLIQARLVRRSGEQIEIAHEALIRNWPRLVEWLDEERDRLRRRLRLAAAAEQWREKGRDPTALRRGVLLQEAKGFDDLNDLEKEFVAASEAAEEEERQKEVRRVQQLLEAEQQRAESERLRAESERRSNRILRVLSAALAVATLIALVSMTIALRSAGTARSGELAVRSLVADEIDLNLLLALESYREADSFEARSALLTALQKTSSEVSAVFTDHDGEAWGVAISPDGRWLVTGDEKGRVLRRDLSNTAVVSEVLRSTRAIYSLAYNRDGNLLAIGLGNGEIQLWDPVTWTKLDTLHGHTKAVFSLAFAPNNPSRLASGSTDTTLVVWDGIGTGNVVSRTVASVSPNDKDWVWSVAFSPDGNRIIAGKRSTGATMWDIGGSVVVSRPLVSPPNSTSVAFSPDTDRPLVASGSSGGFVRLWEVPAGDIGASALSPAYTLTLSGNGQSWGLAFTPDGRTLIASGKRSGATPYELFVWRLTDEAGRPITPTLTTSPLHGHDETILRLAYDPTTGRLASGGTESNVVLWTLTNTRTLVGHEADVVGLSFGSGAINLSSIDTSGQALFWDVPKRESVGEPLPSPMLFANSTSPYVARDGSRLVTQTASGEVYVWDAATQSSILFTRGVSSTALSPDGKVIATGLADGRIQVWDAASRTVSATILAHPLPVYSLAFREDGRALASGSCRREVPAMQGVKCVEAEAGLIDLAAGQLITFTSENAGRGTRVAFGPQGARLALGTDDGVIVLWDAATGERIGLPFLDEEGSGVTSLAFSPNGEFMASGNAAGKVILWDLTAGNRLGKSLIGHIARITSLAFSPDGLQLASGGADHFIIIWDGNFASLRARACAVANRNLTSEERKQYLKDPIDQLPPVIRDVVRVFFPPRSNTCSSQP